MTSNAYMRKKQPELVRRAILEHAAIIAQAEGIAGVTVQGVALAAGVTKGGVFHHFPSKHALIEAMFDEMMERLDAAIDTYLDHDNAYGCFTRAYVDVLLMGEQFGVGSPFDALGATVVTDPAKGASWDRWVEDRLSRHRLTDAFPALEIVRFASDGAWFAYFGRPQGKDLIQLRDRLIAMTRSK